MNLSVESCAQVSPPRPTGGVFRSTVSFLQAVMARQTNKAAGMIFVVLDVIGDFVTEINVTSPTGIRELNKKHGVDIGAMLVDAIHRNLSAA